MSQRVAELCQSMANMIGSVIKAGITSSSDPSSATLPTTTAITNTNSSRTIKALATADRVEAVAENPRISGQIGIDGQTNEITTARLSRTPLPN